MLQMRNAAKPRPSVKLTAPVVRVVIDGITESGRGLLRGILRYARTNTRWHLRVEMEPLRPKGLEWDDDDATIYASHWATLLSEVVARKRPIVNCLAHHECADFKTVRAHDFNIGKLAAHYFLERGFEHFFFYCAKDTSNAAELRSAGFASVLGEAGHVARRHRLEDSTDPMSGLISQILAISKPVALFVSHDHLAREVADVLSSIDLRIPEQVAVLGVDNDELQCDISRPPLSSIQVHYEDIGYRAGAVMDDILQGKDVSPDTTLIDPIGVMTRQSTAIFAVDEGGKEALVNSHQRGAFTVVERREAQFSLRDGTLVTCIFDETAPVVSKSRNYRRRKPL